MAGRAPKKKIVITRSPKDREKYQELFQNNYMPTWRDYERLAAFLSVRGRILPRMVTGLSSRQQRVLATAIKHARHLGLLPFVIG